MRYYLCLTVICTTNVKLACAVVSVVIGLTMD